MANPRKPRDIVFVSSDLKFCRQCGLDKTRSDFTPRKQSWDGLRPECRSCRNQRSQRDYHKDIEASRKRDAQKANRLYHRDTLASAAAMREWRSANPDKAKASQKRCDLGRRDQQIVRNRNRRAKLRSSAGTHTYADVLLLMKKQKSRCAHMWCRKSLADGCHVDHIMPLALDGSNDRRNIQLLCPRCNLRKKAHHPIDFAQKNGLLL